VVPALPPFPPVKLFYFGSFSALKCSQGQLLSKWKRPPDCVPCGKTQFYLSLGFPLRAERYSPQCCFFIDFGDLSLRVLEVGQRISLPWRSPPSSSILLDPFSFPLTFSMPAPASKSFRRFYIRKCSPPPVGRFFLSITSFPLFSPVEAPLPFFFDLPFLPSSRSFTVVCLFEWCNFFFPSSRFLAPGNRFCFEGHQAHSVPPFREFPFSWDAGHDIFNCDSSSDSIFLLVYLFPYDGSLKSAVAPPTQFFCRSLL